MNILYDCNSTGPDPTPRDCREAYLNGCRKDGVYTIDPGCGKPFNVFCDMKKGGWTVFQRRRDGSEDFYRNWPDYVAGFGKLKREFWLGLDRIHCLTSAAPRTELRIDLADFFGNYKYAHYGFFNVNGPSTNYTLDVADYNTNSSVRDRLTYHNGMQFTTKDRDNDPWVYNCANRSDQGAWWFKACEDSNLNGRYRSSTSNQGAIWWVSLGGAVKFTEMKLRPRD